MLSPYLHAYILRLLFFFASMLGAFFIHRITFVLWKIPRRMMITCAKLSANCGHWIFTIILSTIYVSVVGYIIITADANASETMKSADRCFHGEPIQCLRYIAAISVEVGWKFIHYPSISSKLLFPSAYGSDPCMTIQIYLGSKYEIVDAALPTDYNERYSICASTYYGVNIMQTVYGNVFCSVILDYTDHPLHLFHKVVCNRSLEL